MMISDETRKKIEDGLLKWMGVDSDARFEAVQAMWDKIFQPLEDAILASERLTAEDFATRINVRD